MRSHWTPDEVELLKAKFPVTSLEELQTLFPLHPKSAIYSKANELKLRKTDKYRKQYLAVNRENAIKALHGSTPWNKQEPIQKACETCGNTFEVPLYRKDTARFCSTVCANLWKTTIRGTEHPLYTLMDRTCQWCGKAFKTKPAKVAYGEGLYCSRNCLGSAMSKLQQGRRSTLEIAVEQILTALNEPFETQKQLGPWLVDFYLPDRNLVIECDGKYWHSLPEVAKRDRKKNYWLHKNGYKYLRLGEDAIRKDATQTVIDGLQKE